MEEAVVALLGEGDVDYARVGEGEEFGAEGGAEVPGGAGCEGREDEGIVYLGDLFGVGGGHWEDGIGGRHVCGMIDGDLFDQWMCGRLNCSDADFSSGGLRD